MKQTNQDPFLSENSKNKYGLEFIRCEIKHRKSFTSLEYNQPKQLSSPIQQDESYSLRQVQKHKEINLQKEIKQMKDKIRQQQFLIQLQTAVHKQLMNLLSKKKVNLVQYKQGKTNIDKIYQVYQHTEEYLDKAQIYVKNMKKLQQFIP